jgi:hypothetical protein
MSVDEAAVYSEAGGGVNEDIARIHENLAWVIDGSSGLTSKKLTSGPTDARWFVEKVDESLLSRVDNSILLEEILRQVIIQVSESFSKFTFDQNLYPYEYPSCSIAFIRLNGNKLDYLILGDITLAVRTKDNRITVFSDPTVGQLDSQVAVQIKAIQEREKVDFSEARERVRPWLRKNRSMMNNPGGYWVLGLDPAAIDHALVGSLILDGPTQALLASDGFARLVDTLKVFHNWNELFMFIETKGLASAFKRLRESEANDPECLRHPRLKVSDDATAVYLRK